MNLENISKWFLQSNLNQSENYAFATGEKEVEKETEKAVLIKVTSDIGSFKFWCPKSVLSGNCEAVSEPLTYVTINGRTYAKEILIKRDFMLKKLGITKEQVLAM